MGWAVSEVETVALWVGLVVGIASIVLAIFAIWFSQRVEKRSGELIEQSIKSLQKIETTVEYLSLDSREMIKAAWDRMLSNVSDPPTLDRTIDRDADQQVARGIADEVADEYPDEIGGISELTDRLTEALAFVSSIRRDAGGAESVDYAMRALTGLSPHAYALTSVLREGAMHLSRDEYKRLTSQEASVGEVVKELRSAGIIVPLVAGDARDQRVYWYPPGMEGPFQAAISLLGTPDADTHEWAYRVLEEAGWHPADHA